MGKHVLSIGHMNRCIQNFHWETRKKETVWNT